MPSFTSGLTASARALERTQHGRGAGDSMDHFKNKQEAEKVALPAETATEQAKKDVAPGIVHTGVSTPPSVRPTTVAPAPSLAFECPSDMPPGNDKAGKAPFSDGNPT